MKITSFLSSLLLVPFVAAHGDHDIEHEMAVRRAFLENNKADLSHCADKLKKRGHDKRAIQRRSEITHKLRKRSNIKGVFHLLLVPSVLRTRP